MPLFICDQCDCIENTTCGHYWCSNFDGVKPEHKGRAYCSECATPEKFEVDVSKSITRNFGKWHGEFDKKILTEKDVKEYLQFDPDYFIYLGKFEYLKKESER